MKREELIDFMKWYNSEHPVLPIDESDIDIYLLINSSSSGEGRTLVPNEQTQEYCKNPNGVKSCHYTCKMWWACKLRECEFFAI